MGGPLSIREQGSFAVGGRTITDPDGRTFHGDHAYVFYQVPQGARKLPLVFWHGAGQSAKTWETTPDGREGFQNLFLRRAFSVYLVDQPRRGRADAAVNPRRSLPREMNKPCSTSSALGPGRASTPACSSRATRRRWTNTSAR